MTVFDGSLRMSRDSSAAIDVQIDLTDERIRMLSGEVEIGDWALSEIVTNAQPDGIHLRAEGEEVILNLTEDAEFALALGLRTGPPLLMRRVSSLMRQRASK
ncbi:MAG TPA: hypothetical protein VLT15_07525 [Acidimicrobiia bacterium]|nr:hypothetical protein [Acidimicrobiia bacterium]